MSESAKAHDVKVCWIGFANHTWSKPLNVDWYRDVTCVKYLTDRKDIALQNKSMCMMLLISINTAIF